MRVLNLTKRDRGRRIEEEPARDLRGGDRDDMSSKATSPGVSGHRFAVRSLLRWPSPDSLALLLLLVIAIVAASLVGLTLGAL